MIRRTLIAPVLLLLLTVFSMQAFAVGVQPLVVDLNVRPGDRTSFELILTPTDVQQVANLTLFQPVQLITGGLTYQETDPATFPAADWIRLESQSVVVPPNEERVVRGEVTVPFDASGHHTVVIMVEPEADPAAGGIAFRIRYAVRVNILVDRPGLRPRAEVASFELVKDEEGNPTLDMLLRNPTPLQYDAAAEVTIHDSNRRLIQRVPLATGASRQSGRESTRIYPGAEVQYTGLVTEPLFPGEYDVRLFIRYADGMQIVERYPITVEPGEFVQSERGNRLRINPGTVDVSMRPGGLGSSVVQIENRMQEPYTLQYSARDVMPEYSRSIFGVLDVQLRAQDGELGARRTARTVITVRSDRDVEPGGYYGYLDVHLLQGEEHVETYTVPIHVLVDGNITYSADVVGVHSEVLDGEQLYTVDMRNASVAHIAPRGTLYLKDGEGVIQQTVQLTMQPGVESILPEMSGLLVGSGIQVDAGEYAAEIRITHNGSVIGVEELPLNIEPAEGDQ